MYGKVRDAFRARGHNAWSCDIEDCEPKNEYHLKGDVLSNQVLHFAQWDMVIAFPPCTYLCSSGLHWNKRVPGRAAKTERALNFVRRLMELDVPQIALENPVGCIGTQIRKADQKIQPWMFGDDASKGTCLWLKGLPKLIPTKIVPPAGWRHIPAEKDLEPCVMCGGAWCEQCEMHWLDCNCMKLHDPDVTYKKVDGFMFGTYLEPPVKPVWANQTPSGQNKLGPSPDRAKIRAKTYDGIAEAMAMQWG
jgi:hypothetical protein